MLSYAALVIEPDHTATLWIEGEWTLKNPLENRTELIAAFKAPHFTHLIITAKDLTGWDSSLVALLVHLISLCKKNGVSYKTAGLPDGVNRLIHLALTVPPRKKAAKSVQKLPFIEKIGTLSISCWSSIKKAAFFTHETLASLCRFLNKKAIVRKTDIILAIQNAGADALGIVSLICFMVGLILAFIGAVQLRMFGAQIYVASLVAIAMSRVMGAVMAGVIMAGRTGSSYAATLGSMQVNEEIDALKTMGVSSFDFLVLPRFIALSLMMPLLTIYAVFMGIMGGAFVGIFMLDLTPYEYFDMTMKALSSKNIIIGIVHGAAFGVIVSLCGCYQGMISGRDASAVGKATTAAVVTSIVGIVIATALITLICNALGV